MECHRFAHDAWGIDVQLVRFDAQLAAALVTIYLGSQPGKTGQLAHLAQRDVLKLPFDEEAAEMLGGTLPLSFQIIHFPARCERVQLRPQISRDRHKVGETHQGLQLQHIRAYLTRCRLLGLRIQNAQIQIGGG